MSSVLNRRASSSKTKAIPPERGVERHRQTGSRRPRPGRCARRVVQGACAAPPRAADGRPHLHGGAFAAKRQTGADGEHAPDKLDRQHGDGGGRGFAAHHGLDVLHAAAGGQGREALHQPGRYRHEDRGDRHRNHPADLGPLLRPAEERVAEGLSLLQAQPKPGAHHPGEEPAGRGGGSQAAEVVPASYGRRRLRLICGLDGHGGSVTRRPRRRCSITRPARRSQAGTWSTMNRRPVIGQGGSTRQAHHGRCGAWGR